MIFVLVVYKVASLNCYFSFLQTGGKRACFFTIKRMREREIKNNESHNRCIRLRSSFFCSQTRNRSLLLQL